MVEFSVLELNIGKWLNGQRSVCSKIDRKAQTVKMRILALLTLMRLFFQISIE